MEGVAMQAAGRAAIFPNPPVKGAVCSVCRQELYRVPDRHAYQCLCPECPEAGKNLDVLDFVPPLPTVYICIDCGEQMSRVPGERRYECHSAICRPREPEPLRSVPLWARCKHCQRIVLKSAQYEHEAECDGGDHGRREGWRCPTCQTVWENRKTCPCCV